MKHHLRFLPIVLLAALSTPLASLAQQMPENLQFFPEGTTRDEVVAKMRHFSFALGVRCSHCHAQNEEEDGLDFPSDDNPNKDKARYMLRMLRTINTELLPGLDNRDDPPVEVTCKTCHRGTPKPRILGQEMLLAAHDGGGDAAVAKFNELRENYDNSGTYDFQEWETNTVAERLAAAGQHEDAIIVYKMNLERFPESTGIWFGLAESYEALGDLKSAIPAYEKVVELAPNWQQMKDKLAELKGE